jgi:hypothetical protein
MSLSLRLAISFSFLPVWGVLYLASRLGSISLIRFTPWLRAGFIVLLGASLILFVFDRTRLANVLAIHAWGLFGAQYWTGRNNKREPQEVVTSLKL